LLAQADPELRHEVESLLAQQCEEGPLDPPALEIAAKLFDDATLTRLTVGKQLGPYKIESFLGAGGMGQVYKARDTRLGRAVAIKVSSKQFNACFEREARAISSLNHPHICTLYDAGPDYLLMIEFVDSRDERVADRFTRGRVK
jgi:serine/threonine protein kinase